MYDTLIQLISRINDCDLISNLKENVLSKSEFDDKQEYINSVKIFFQSIISDIKTVNQKYYLTDIINIIFSLDIKNLNDFHSATPTRCFNIQEFNTLVSLYEKNFQQ